MGRHPRRGAAWTTCVGRSESWWGRVDPQASQSPRQSPRGGSGGPGWGTRGHGPGLLPLSRPSPAGVPSQKPAAATGRLAHPEEVEGVDCGAEAPPHPAFCPVFLSGVWHQEWPLRAPSVRRCLVVSGRPMELSMRSPRPGHVLTVPDMRSTSQRMRCGAQA